MKKKIIYFFILLIMLFGLAGCGDKEEEKESKRDKTKQQEKLKEKEKEKEEEKKEEKKDDEIIDDDEIIEPDDEDNKPPKDNNVTVEEVINCEGCVFAYFSDEGEKAKTLGSTLSPSEYTNDINNLKTAGGKQRHNFFGLVLFDNKISKAYACILKDNKIYCIEGSVDGSHHSNNIGILNEVFNASQCRTISDGNTYTCSDGSYNGDTKTSGYTSMHYETSCTIYGANANTGKLICH